MTIAYHRAMANGVISFRANAIKRNAGVDELEMLVRNLRMRTG